MPPGAAAAAIRYAVSKLVVAPVVVWATAAAGPQLVVANAAIVHRPAAERICQPLSALFVEEDFDGNAAVQTVTRVLPPKSPVEGGGSNGIAWQIPIGYESSAKPTRRGQQLARKPLLLNALTENTQARAIVQGSQVHEANVRLREEIRSARIEGAEVSEENQRLRAQEARLHRALAAVRAAGDGPGSAERKVVLLSLVGACSATIIVGLVACCFAAAATHPRKRPSLGADGGMQGQQRGLQRQQRGCCPFVADHCLCVDGFQSWICCCCGCRCSPPTLLASVIFAALWSAGVAVMWHFGIMQPFVKQLVVYLYIMLGMAVVLAIALMEAWNTLGAMFQEVLFVVDWTHRKINEILKRIGLEDMEAASPAAVVTSVEDMGLLSGPPADEASPQSDSVSRTARAPTSCC